MKASIARLNLKIIFVVQLTPPMRRKDLMSLNNLYCCCNIIIHQNFPHKAMYRIENQNQQIIIRNLHKNRSILSLFNCAQKQSLNARAEKKEREFICKSILISKKFLLVIISILTTISNSPLCHSV